MNSQKLNKLRVGSVVVFVADEKIIKYKITKILSKNSKSAKCRISWISDDNTKEKCEWVFENNGEWDLSKYNVLKLCKKINFDFLKY